MPNTVLTVDKITKESLLILSNELKIWDTLYRAHEDEFTDKTNGYRAGSSVRIRRPMDYQVIDGPSISSYQDTVEGYTTLTIDRQKTIPFQFTSTELTLSIDDLSERVLKPAMVKLANEITRDLLSTLYLGTNNWVGTPGQLVNSFADFLKAPERLNILAVPVDQRNAVLSPSDHAALLAAQTALFIAEPSKGAYRAGMLGELSGVDTRMNQMVPLHTVGALGGTPLVNGASQNVTYDTAKNSWTQTLVLDGASNSIAGWAKKGDVITIAGVNSVNPQTKVSTGAPQQFVVTADADSSGAGAVTLTITPPIISAAGQPHRNCSAAPADNAAITVVGTAATGYLQNLVYHKNAMALAMVPMEMPAGAVNGSRQTYKGMSVRLIPGYTHTSDVSVYRLDVLYGAKVIEPNLAVRLSGTA